MVDSSLCVETEGQPDADSGSLSVLSTPTTTNSSKTSTYSGRNGLCALLFVWLVSLFAAVHLTVITILIWGPAGSRLTPKTKTGYIGEM